jgi:hypothetical protein
MNINAQELKSVSVVRKFTLDINYILNVMNILLKNVKIKKINYIAMTHGN